MLFTPNTQRDSAIAHLWHSLNMCAKYVTSWVCWSFQQRYYYSYNLVASCSRLPPMCQCAIFDAIFWGDHNLVHQLFGCYLIFFFAFVSSVCLWKWAVYVVILLFSILCIVLLPEYGLQEEYTYIEWAARNVHAHDVHQRHRSVIYIYICISTQCLIYNCIHWLALSVVSVLWKQTHRAEGSRRHVLKMCRRWCSDCCCCCCWWKL